LFDQTAALHGLGPAERGLLEVAGLLHDVGYDVSQSAHHKHSLYLIRNADLDGFTSRERDLIANVARYHRKALPADRHAEYMALDDADRTLVRRLAALLRLADGLDADHFQVVEAATVVDQGNLIRLELTTRVIRLLEAAETAGTGPPDGRGHRSPISASGRCPLAWAAARVGSAWKSASRARP
jgi:exopolyphosphatase / guanosine-5'-triphosphate,3'-diphosphate pyrophosphatase